MKRGEATLIVSLATGDSEQGTRTLLLSLGLVTFQKILHHVQSKKGLKQMKTSVVQPSNDVACITGHFIQPSHILDLCCRLVLRAFRCCLLPTVPIILTCHYGSAAKRD